MKRRNRKGNDRMNQDGVIGGVSQEELLKRIEEARKRMRETPRIWAPKAGDEKAILFIKVQTIKTDIGDSDFFVLEDLADGQRYSVPKSAVLENHMQVGGMYLLRYNGKRQGKSKGRSPYHDWAVEEIMAPAGVEGAAGAETPDKSVTQEKPGTKAK